MEKSTDKVIEKIKKLIKLKEGAEDIGSIEEAANAAARIQELIMKHNIRAEDIKDEVDQGPKIIVVQTKLGQKHSYSKIEGKWMLSLVTVITRENMCKAVFYPATKTNNSIELYLFGTKENIEMVWYLCEQLIERIRHMRKAAYKKALTLDPFIKRNGFMRAYSQGVVIALALKLKEQRQKFTETVSSTALVVVENHQKAVDEKIQQDIGGIKKTKNKTLKNQMAKNMGFKDGQNMDIHKGISGNNKYGLE